MTELYSVERLTSDLDDAVRSFQMSQISFAKSVLSLDPNEKEIELKVTRHTNKLKKEATNLKFIKMSLMIAKQKAKEAQNG